MTGFSQHSFAFALAFATCLLSTFAFAEPTAAEKETARALMAEGRLKRTRNELKGALQDFQAADTIMHVPTTGLEVARVQIALGLLVEARDTLRRVVHEATVENEPTAFADARAKAQTMDDELVGRIPTLRLVLHNVAPNVEPGVTVDNVKIPPVALSLPYRINPGRHVIVGKAYQFSTPPQTIELGDQQRTLEVTLDFTGAKPKPKAVLLAEAEARKSAEHASSGRLAAPWLAVTGFSLAGVGVVTGIVGGALAITNRSSADCVNNSCPASTFHYVQTAKTFATVSTVGFIVGGVGLAAGIVGILVHKPGTPLPADADKPPVLQSNFSIHPSIDGVYGTF